MKWIFRDTLFSAAVLTCASICYPANVYTIHSLEQASHFERKPGHSFENAQLANWFVSVGVGSAHPQFDSTMSVNNGSDAPSPFDQDIYSTHRRAGAVIDFSAGRRWMRDTKWLPAYSFGLACQTLFSTNVGDTVMQYSSPDFVNYKYKSNISSNVLSAFAKLNLVNYRFLSPFVTAGAGCAFNRSSGYSETALADVTARNNPEFASKTTSHFAYNLGAGIDFNVSKRLAISVDYKYLNLGKVTSGSGVGAWLSQLNLGSLKAHEVFINATYFMGK